MDGRFLTKQSRSSRDESRGGDSKKYFLDCQRFNHKLKLCVAQTVQFSARCKSSYPWALIIMANVPNVAPTQKKYRKTATNCDPESALFSLFACKYDSIKNNYVKNMFVVVFNFAVIDRAVIASVG